MRVTLGRRVNPRDERGATFLIVALCLIAIFGMVVLVVDIGGALVVRHQMVRSADSASLASAYSYAKRLAVCGTDDPTVRATVALPYATDNLAASVTDYMTDCPNKTVTVGVESSMRQFLFAPIIGGPSQRTVHATATAEWGPLGGGNAVPIVLESGRLQGDCDVPNPNPPAPCSFWYDNNNLGSADWGFMNLDLWDVAANANCSNAGASDRSDWIFGGYPSLLTLNGPPAPTYVCVDTGHTSRDWQDLKQDEGKSKLFPVNDCNGQVDSSGTVTPCPATPDKYDIIGFTQLKILHVYQGNDPLAVGQSGTCTQNNQSFIPNGTLDLDTFVGGGGCPPTQADTISGVHLYPRSGPEYVQCAPGDLSATCDYWYDPSSHVITWRKPAVSRVQLQFDWSIGAACPGHSSDPNAICLVTVWESYTVGPGPVGGQDFGPQAVQLIR